MIVSCCAEKKKKAIATSNWGCLLARVARVNRALGAMIRSIPFDISRLRDIARRSREVLALLHRGEEGVPFPILRAVHISQQISPGIDLDLTGPGQIQSVDRGTACIAIALTFLFLPCHSFF